MKHHKITCEQDVIELQKSFDNDPVFECIETGEQFSLSEMHFNADWNDWETATIKQVWRQTVEKEYIGYWDVTTTYNKKDKCIAIKNNACVEFVSKSDMNINNDPFIDLERLLNNKKSKHWKL